MKLRVLEVCNAMTPDGIPNYIMNYYRAMNHEIVQFDFMKFMNGGDFFDDEIKSLGGRVYEIDRNLPQGSKGYIKRLRLFYDFLKKNKYDVVHFHDCNGAKSLAVLVAKMARVPVRIAHSHSTDIEDRSFFSKLMHNCLKQVYPICATDYFACSQEGAYWLFPKRIVNSHKVTILHNAINAKEFTYNESIREETRKELGIKDGQYLIGHVGRFDRQKNHEFIIDIFEKIVKKDNNAILLLVGIGKLEEEIKNRAKSLGIYEKIIFYGATKEVNKMMQAMDIFILPSLFEGLGIVNIEAQAAGLHCIVSDTVPEFAKINELLEFVSLKESAEKWAEKILKYKGVECRRDTYREIVESGYDIAEDAKILMEFYLKRESECVKK